MYGLKKYKRLFFTLFLLTIFNIFIYIWRDYFHYQPQSSYHQLYTNCLDKTCLNKWKKSKSQFSREDINAAYNISKTEAGIKESDNTQIKLEKLFVLLYEQFNDQISIPTLEFSTKSALEKYFALQNNKEQLWCGNFAEMFLLFCTANNIVCRYVEIFKPSGHHVVNECYVPEANNWTLVDLTTNVFNILKNKQYIALLDIAQQPVPSQNLQLSYSDTNGRIQYDTSAKRLSVLKSYTDSAPKFYYYYSIHLEKIYATSDKIKRYLLPASWYEFSSTERSSNFPFFFKLFVFSLWIINAITLLFIIIYDRSKRSA